MTVQELFEKEKIDLDFLEGLEEVSSYWVGVVNFITEKWRQEIELLSVKQAAWLTRILDDCVEKRIESQVHARA